MLTEPVPAELIFNLIFVVTVLFVNIRSGRLGKLCYFGRTNLRTRFVSVVTTFVPYNKYLILSTT